MKVRIDIRNTYVGEYIDPQSIDEAQARKHAVCADIETLKHELSRDLRCRSDGTPMTDEEHMQWRRKATAVLKKMIKERNKIDSWINEYRREVNIEHKEEERQKAIERQMKRLEVISFQMLLGAYAILTELEQQEKLTPKQLRRLHSISTFVDKNLETKEQATHQGNGASEPAIVGRIE